MHNYYISVISPSSSKNTVKQSSSVLLFVSQELFETDEEYKLSFVIFLCIKFMATAYLFDI
jgi:hypothetical protein